MKIIWVIIISFLSLSCLGQEQTRYDRYDLLKRQAMLNYVDGHYQEALIKFKAAFKIIPDDAARDYFYAASAALHLKKDSMAKRLIIKAIVRTNADEDYFSRFKGFKNFRDNPLFQQIKNKYAEYTTQFFANLKHPKIYKIVDSLVKEDQRVRSTQVSAEEFRRVDSLNAVRLIAITKKYGWQPKGWLILWHHRRSYQSNNHFWSFFHPFINKQIKAGKIRKRFWVPFADNKAAHKEGKQIYGTYWGQFKLYPLKDVKDVDKRRKKVGLAPMWYMHKVYGYKLPSGYTTPDTLSLQ